MKHYKKQQYVVCRDCDEEFDTKHPENKIGYFNQCGECAEELGFNQDKKVKAITHRNSAGDFMGIELVSEDEFNKYNKEQEETGKILSGR
jgi:hypothetical protein